jgi:transposase-like protein
VAGGLDDMVISLYAHGMSTRDITHHLEQVYGTVLSAETVSRITEQVMEEARAWQSRPLDPVYAVVFLDAIVVKVRDNNVVANKPAYLAIGIDTDGDKHVLGIWLAKTALESATAGEGAAFWRRVTADLRNRGVQDILIACCDGLAGFEDAIHSAFPETTGILFDWCHARTASVWPPSSRRSIPPWTPTPRCRPWPPSPRQNSAASTRKPSRYGNRNGSR